ncbi:MAG TPA: 2OG-Fe(II) oxygenase [Alphaproteobacteria bacterium]|nr:2OG-Fe(II) oxygenase [Alphaproteobacteria bacterium]
MSKKAAAEFPNIDPAALAAGLDRDGYTIVPALLGADACRDLAALYDREELFRSRIVMARHAFGLGEYKYFRYPLPSVIQSLRETLYSHLVVTANRWCEWLGAEERYPATLVDYLAICHEAGQARPTPLILKYEAGGYNCLHQDLYGALAFPLQATILLSSPRDDFTGGEFLLVEQRPRAQSKGEVVALARGDAVIFAVNRRPVAGKRGFYRVALRHGVSRVHSGHRHTLGIIFHDAA